MSRARRRIVLLFAAALTVLALAPTAGAHQRPAGYGATTLALDPGAAEALKKLGVTPGVVAPATAEADGLRFPITNSVFSALCTRQIRHSGGISLTAGATTVTLTDFIINLDRRPDLTARINGGDRASILDLSLRGASLRVHPGVTLGPVTATLTAGAAGALNDAFGVTAFTEGLTLGQATVDYAIGGRPF
jgi:hypothetical protein